MLTPPRVFRGVELSYNTDFASQLRDVTDDAGAHSGIVGRKIRQQTTLQANPLGYVHGTLALATPCCTSHSVQHVLLTGLGVCGRRSPRWRGRGAVCRASVDAARCPRAPGACVQSCSGPGSSTRLK